MKTLVVWYSNSGATTCVAEQIAEQLGAETEVVEESRTRPVLLVDGEKPAAGGAMVKAAMAAVLGMSSAIVESRKDPAEYDLVVVGTPVWAGSLTPGMRSYLKRHRKALSKVAFFCTAGDPSKLRVFKQMRRLARRDPVATLAVKSDEARGDACAGELCRFVEQLKSAE